MCRISWCCVSRILRNYHEDELFQKYIKEGVIDSTIEKPVTLSRLCQRVRGEFQNYELAIQKGKS